MRRAFALLALLLTSAACGQAPIDFGDAAGHPQSDLGLAAESPVDEQGRVLCDSDILTVEVVGVDVSTTEADLSDRPPQATTTVAVADVRLQFVNTSPDVRCRYPEQVKVTYFDESGAPVGAVQSIIDCDRCVVTNANPAPFTSSWLVALRHPTGTAEILPHGRYRASVEVTASMFLDGDDQVHQHYSAETDFQVDLP